MLNMNLFYFDPIQADLLFESPKSKFVESKAIVIEHFDLVQTHERIELKELVDLGPFTLPRQFVHDDPIFRTITHMLANFEYVCLFSDWARQFDKLKQALTCVELPWWMYSFLFHLVAVSRFHLLEGFLFV